MTVGGLGLLLAIGIAILIYIAVRFMEHDYYQRRHDIIKKKLERADEAKRGDHANAGHSNSGDAKVDGEKRREEPR